MDDERDAQDAIRALDRTGHGRRLRVEWTKQERGDLRSAGSRRSSANLRPTKTLFVINIDPTSTRVRDIERHFDPFGKILNVRIGRNFAFVHGNKVRVTLTPSKCIPIYHTLDLVTENQPRCHKLMDRVISVEYTTSDDNDRRNRYSPHRGQDRTPERNHDHGRPPSPYGRAAEQTSPDYSHGSSPHAVPEERGTANFGRGESPANRRYSSRSPVRSRSQD